MKKRECSHWEKNNYFEGMLLFAQAVEESTFNFSYESYKVPALNSHYLCYDLIQTALDINRKILMDGNFVPLSEEFEQILQDDLFINTVIGDGKISLLIKDKTARYYNLEEKELKVKIKHYPEIATYIKDVCEVDNMYLRILLNIIIDNIFVEEFKYKNGENIYAAARMLISELINAGYSKEYIYFTVLDTFFNPSNQVNCCEDTIIDFFNYFTFKEYEYQAILGINRKAAYVLQKLENLNVRKATNDERRQLNLQRKNDYVVSFTTNSIDAYSAYEDVTAYMQMVLSLHRINQHNSKLFISSKAIIEKRIDDNTYVTQNIMHSPINSMKKKGNLSNLHAVFNDITLINKIEPPSAFYKSIILHNEAIESNDVSNQLLNLWTIVETLIDTKRDNEDKINTICTTLCAVLNRCYLYNCLEQLLHDIITCTNADISALINNIDPNNEDIDAVERFALLLTLDENVATLDRIKQELLDYPLLKYRLRLFSEHVFADSNSIYEYLKRHEKRIKWHIMRIYRNRNMIVHSGTYMPYRNIIIENLHYYVDVLFDTLIEYYHVGLLNHTSIYNDILIREKNHYIKLGINIRPKEKKSVIQLNKENALKLIFNGYNGNSIKKAINQVIEDNKKESLPISNL